MLIAVELKQLLRKAYVCYQRQQRVISACLYLLLLTVSLYAVYDPITVLGFFLPITMEDDRMNQVKEEMPVFFKFTTTPRVVPHLRQIDLPFSPRQTHQCEEMFYQSGHNFSYAEFYMEHMDAYKSALSITGVMGESNVNEQSWAFHEMAKMGFVSHVCETGFFAGHNTFHWLTAKTDITVYSFEGNNYNWTEDMATFMAAEFPDHFYFYQGDTAAKISQFSREHNTTRCDIVYIDSSSDENAIYREMEAFRKVVNPAQNIFIMDLHGEVEASRGHRVWGEMKRKGYITERFRCKFSDGGDVLSTRTHNVSGFYVGSIQV